MVVSDGCVEVVAVELMQYNVNVLCWEVLWLYGK